MSVKHCSRIGSSSFSVACRLMISDLYLDVLSLHSSHDPTRSACKFTKRKLGVESLILLN